MSRKTHIGNFLKSAANELKVIQVNPGLPQNTIFRTLPNIAISYDKFTILST